MKKLAKKQRKLHCSRSISAAHMHTNIDWPRAVYTHTNCIRIYERKYTIVSKVEDLSLLIQTSNRDQYNCTHRTHTRTRGSRIIRYVCAHVHVYAPCAAVCECV